MTDHSHIVFFTACGQAIVCKNSYPMAYVALRNKINAMRCRAAGLKSLLSCVYVSAQTCCKV